MSLQAAHHTRMHAAREARTSLQLGTCRRLLGILCPGMFAVGRRNSYGQRLPSPRWLCAPELGEQGSHIARLGMHLVTLIRVTLPCLFFAGLKGGSVEDPWPRRGRLRPSGPSPTNPDQWVGISHGSGWVRKLAETLLPRDPDLWEGSSPPIRDLWDI